MASVRLPPRGRWQAIIRDAQGRRHFVSTGVPRDQPEHVARRRALELERDLLLERRADALALADALDDLRAAYVRRGARPGTLEILEQKGRRLVEHWGPGLDVHALGLVDALAYVDARRAAGVSMHTAAKELGALRSALRHAQRLGRYRGDPAVAWPGDVFRGAYRPRERWLPHPEYREVLARIGHAWRPHLVVSVWTGVRASELFALRPEHRLERDDGLWLAVPGTKTAGARRTIPCPPEAWAALEAAPLGGNRHSWAMALRRACARAGVPPASPNDLRRTFASWHANAGTPEAETARLLGHGSSVMVRRVYGQLAPSTLARSTDRMREAVLGATPCATSKLRGA